MKNILNTAYKGLKDAFRKFEHVHQSELCAVLPSKRDNCHDIETETNEKQPHRSLYQLTPIETKATKKYVEDLMKKGKISPGKYPYGPPIFLYSGKGKAVTNFSGMSISITCNRNELCSILLVAVKFFSKMSLKTVFIRFVSTPKI